MNKLRGFTRGGAVASRPRATDRILDWIDATWLS